MKKQILIIFFTYGFILSFLFFVASCKRRADQMIINNQSGLNIDIEKKVDSVLNLMHLNEKIGQLMQYSGKWNATGPSSTKGDQHKLNKLKKGEVGSMLTVTTVASIRETQKIVMDHSRLKIPLIFAYDVIHGDKTNNFNQT